jgi:hypothetical protein
MYRCKSTLMLELVVLVVLVMVRMAATTSR